LLLLLELANQLTMHGMSMKSTQHYVLYLSN